MPGYSLLEVLVAVALLATVAAATIRVLGSGQEAAREAAHRARAVLAAEELITRYQLFPPAAEPGAPGAIPIPEGCDPPEATARAAADGLALSAWAAELACALPEPEARAEVEGRRVRVEIRWRDGSGGDPATVELEGRL